MIVIDTNVISEMMRPSPEPTVVSWMDQQEINALFITSVTIAEITYGIHALPNGHRKQSLKESFENVVNFAFKHRVLSFNEAAAHTFGEIMGKRKALGHPMSILDGQIAAIAVVNNFAIATRNVPDFIHCEVDLINPFD